MLLTVSGHLPEGSVFKVQRGAPRTKLVHVFALCSEPTRGFGRPSASGTGSDSSIPLVSAVNVVAMITSALRKAVDERYPSQQWNLQANRSSFFSHENPSVAQIALICVQAVALLFTMCDVHS
jgi:hypothetical protein